LSPLYRFDNKSASDSCIIRRDILGILKMILDKKIKMIGDVNKSSEGGVKLKGKTRIEQTMIPSPATCKKRVIKDYLRRKCWMSCQCRPIPCVVKILS
jgi:hypothetical protein